MTTRSAVASDTAGRLWTRAGGGGSTPEDVGAAAERMCTQLRGTLGRWIGTDGYRALFARALATTRTEHPALAGLAGLGGNEPVTIAAVKAHGAEQVSAGMVALVAAVIDLLGRVIGEDMAVRLVEQIDMPGPHGIVSSQRSGGRNG